MKRNAASDFVRRSEKLDRLWQRVIATQNARKAKPTPARARAADAAFARWRRAQ